MVKGQGRGTDTSIPDEVFTSKEYIEREAAIKRFTFATLDCLGMEPMIRSADVVAALKSIPAADVVPVVRCGECKHWKRIRNDCFLASCELYALVRSEDFFCADGVRMDMVTDSNQVKDGDGE